MKLKKMPISYGITLDFLYLFLGIVTGESIFWFLLIINLVILVIYLAVVYYKYESEVSDLYDYTLDKQFFKIIWLYYQESGVSIDTFEDYELLSIWQLFKEVAEEKHENVDWIDNVDSFFKLTSLAINWVVFGLKDNKNHFSPSNESLNLFHNFIENMKLYLNNKDTDNSSSYYSQLRMHFRLLYNSLLDDEINL